LTVGLSGCLFHHKSHDNDDNDSDTSASDNPAPAPKTGHHMVRSRASDMADMLHHPSRHLGQYVSSYGPVRLINPQEGGGTQFQITTPNYAYLFIVNFPGEIPNLEQNRDTYFLGTLRGVQGVGDAEALVVEGIAIQTTGGRGMNPYAWPKAIYIPGQEEVVANWIGGTLDLNGGMSVASRRSPEMAAAPAYAAPQPMYAAPQPAPTYYAQQPAYAPPAQPVYAPQPQPAYAPAPAPAWSSGGNGLSSASLIKVVQNWNSLPPEARERILGIVSEYSR